MQSANASNANRNANANFEQFCHSNRAQIRTRKVVDSFQDDLSFFLPVRDKIWSFGIMAQVESDMEEIIVLYLYAKQQRKRKRHVSVHKILQRKSEFGEYHHLQTSQAKYTDASAKLCLGMVMRASFFMWK